MQARQTRRRVTPNVRGQTHQGSFGESKAVRTGEAGSDRSFQLEETAGILPSAATLSPQPCGLQLFLAQPWFCTDAGGALWHLWLCDKEK